MQEEQWAGSGFAKNEEDEAERHDGEGGERQMLRLCVLYPVVLYCHTYVCYATNVVHVRSDEYEHNQSAGE